MNVCISGGCGFIGGHLVDRLINDNHNVVVLDNLSSGTYKNPKAKFYELDISKASVSELTNILIDNNIEYVFHLAAQIDLRKSFTMPVFDAQTNIMGTLNLASAAECASIKKFVFASTGGAMYSEDDTMPWVESLSPAPQSPYALSKLCSEKYLQLLWPTRSIILRFANVYGPRQNPHGEAGVIAIFVNKIINGLPCVIFGDGTQVRDYIYVDDVVEACIKSLTLENLSDGNIFNISTGVGRDLNTLLLKMIAIFDTKCSVKYDPPKHGEIKRSILNPNKFTNATGWIPSINLNDGLEKTIEWFRSA